MITSRAQRNYLEKLSAKCKERGIEIPVEILEEIDDLELSSLRASEIIDALKFELGWRK